MQKPKSKRSYYSEFSTNAYIWARSASTKPGDLKVLSVNGRRFALIEATDDGFVELKKGAYKEVSAEYERIHGEKDTSFYENTEEIRTEQNGNLWDMQSVKDGGYAADDGGQTGSEGLQDNTTGNNEHLRRGDKGESINKDSKGDKSNISYKLHEYSDEYFYIPDSDEMQLKDYIIQENRRVGENKKWKS